MVPLILIVGGVLIYFFDPEVSRNTFKVDITTYRNEWQPDTVACEICAVVTYKTLTDRYELWYTVACREDSEYIDVHNASLIIWAANNINSSAQILEKPDSTSLDLFKKAQPKEIKNKFIISVAEAKTKLGENMVGYMKKSFPQQNFSDKVYKAWSERED